MIYQRESINDMWDDFIANELSHWDETEGYRHDQPFNPDKDRYFQYAEMGAYFMWAARDGDILAGNVTMYVTPSMHTRLLLATEDTFYIRPEYRGGGVYSRLFKMVENDLKEMGVYEVILTAKLSNRAGKLLERKGCKHIANQYSKYLVQTAPSIEEVA